MDENNIYEKILGMFGKQSDNFSVLQEEVDLNMQMEYFEFSREHKDIKNPEELIARKDDLFDPTITDEEKKQLLVQLASLNEVEVYRTIERYAEDPPKSLAKWVTLALQESRMLLESNLLDEKQIFISTGLGGRGSKLRYFVVLISKEKKGFTPVQQKVIHNEIDFALKQNNSELENMRFAHYFATLLAAIPLQVSIRDLFRQAIKECNQLGDFIMPNFLVTNVKKLSDEEVIDFLENNKDLQDHSPSDDQGKSD